MKMKRQLSVGLLVVLALMLGLVAAQARYLNPNTGMFWTMDSYEGEQGDPLSLHKYLYTYANPVMNTDPSGNEIVSMLTAIIIDNTLATIVSPVSSKLAANLGKVDFKFEVATGSLGLHTMYSGAVRWGQPEYCAEGGYSIGNYTASSWVKVRSRNDSGGSCNTVDNAEPSGTIALHMRSKVPSPVEVYANVRFDLSGTGPAGNATGEVYVGSKVLFSDKAINGVSIHEERPVVFKADVGPNWKPVIKYVPTISFVKDNGVRSTGRSGGVITLKSFRTTQ